MLLKFIQRLKCCSKEKGGKLVAGDVLSQNEIDALLSALSTGEMDADELKRKIKTAHSYI